MKEQSNRIESFDLDRAESEFLARINTTGVSEHDVTRAYELLLLGEKSTETQIEMLRQYMEELADRGFPLNRFPNIFSKVIAHESNSTYIDTLPVSEKEQRIVKSIVEKSRIGELVIYRGDDPYASITINKMGTHEDKKEFISALQELFSSIPKDKEISLTFAEN